MLAEVSPCIWLEGTSASTLGKEESSNVPTLVPSHDVVLGYLVEVGEVLECGVFEQVYEDYPSWS